MTRRKQIQPKRLDDDVKSDEGQGCNQQKTGSREEHNNNDGDESGNDSEESSDDLLSYDESIEKSTEQKVCMGIRSEPETPDARDELSPPPEQFSSSQSNVTMVDHSSDIDDYPHTINGDVMNRNHSKDTEMPEITPSKSSPLGTPSWQKGHLVDEAESMAYRSGENQPLDLSRKMDKKRKICLSDSSEPSSSLQSLQQKFGGDTPFRSARRPRLGLTEQYYMSQLYVAPSVMGSWRKSQSSSNTPIKSNKDLASENKDCKSINELALSDDTIPPSKGDLTQNSKTVNAILAKINGTSDNETAEKFSNKHTTHRCSCQKNFLTLFELSIHLQETGHSPGVLKQTSLMDYPKLVRGQDMWLNQGSEQTKQILRCIQCGESFKTLPELTVHMMETQHYTKIVSTEHGQKAHKCSAYCERDTTESDCVFKCKICQEAYPDMEALANHMIVSGHHRRQPCRPHSSGSRKRHLSDTNIEETQNGTDHKRNRLRVQLFDNHLTDEFRNKSPRDKNIVCENCGERIEMEHFVEHIRLCLRKRVQEIQNSRRSVIESQLLESQRLFSKDKLYSESKRHSMSASSRMSGERNLLSPKNDRRTFSVDKGVKLPRHVHSKDKKHSIFTNECSKLSTKHSVLNSNSQDKNMSNSHLAYPSYSASNHVVKDKKYDSSEIKHSEKYKGPTNFQKSVICKSGSQYSRLTSPSRSKDHSSYKHKVQDPVRENKMATTSESRPSVLELLHGSSGHRGSKVLSSPKSVKPSENQNKAVQKSVSLMPSVNGIKCEKSRTPSPIETRTVEPSSKQISANNNKNNENTSSNWNSATVALRVKTEEESYSQDSTPVKNGRSKSPSAIEQMILEYSNKTLSDPVSYLTKLKEMKLPMSRGLSETKNLDRTMTSGEKSKSDPESNDSPELTTPSLDIIDPDCPNNSPSATSALKAMENLIQKSFNPKNQKSFKRRPPVLQQPLYSQHGWCHLREMCNQIYPYGQNCGEVDQSEKQINKDSVENKEYSGSNLTTALSKGSVMEIKTETTSPKPNVTDLDKNIPKKESIVSKYLNFPGESSAEKTKGKSSALDSLSSFVYGQPLTSEHPLDSLQRLITKADSPVLGSSVNSRPKPPSVSPHSHEPGDRDLDKHENGGNSEDVPLNLTIKCQTLKNENEPSVSEGEETGANPSLDDGLTANSDGESTDYLCPSCSRHFATKGSYRYHLSRCHLSTVKKYGISTAFHMSPYIYLPLDHTAKFTKYYEMAQELASKELALEELEK